MEFEKKNKNKAIFCVYCDNYNIELLFIQLFYVFIDP